MAETLRIGLIGLDSSHCLAFTELMNNFDNPYHVDGGLVVAAYPDGSSELKMSHSRIQGFVEELQKRFRVKIVDSLEKLAKDCDAIMILSVDGRTHLSYFKKVARYGKPVFIDKPIANSFQDALEIFCISRECEIPIMSTSALRFAFDLNNPSEKSDIIGVDVFGPMPIEAKELGLSWYGIHTVEILYTLLGQGCIEVVDISNDDSDVIIGTWKDKRIGVIRGIRTGHNKFGAVIHKKQTVQFIECPKDMNIVYANLLKQLIHFFHTGVSVVDKAETLEIVRFLEAVTESKTKNKSIEI